MAKIILQKSLRINKNSSMKRKTLERTLFYALLIIFLIGCKDLNHDLLGDYIIEEASIDSISVLRTELIQINSLFLSIPKP